MKKLIIVVIILFLMICTGCPMGYDPSSRALGQPSLPKICLYVEGCLLHICRSKVSSNHLQPKQLAITVTADGTDYIIAPLATLELKEEGTDD